MITLEQQTTPEINNNTSEFDLADYYRNIEAQEERRLDTPELDDILEVAVADGLLTQEKFDELQNATGDERYRLKEEIFGNLNPRDLRKGFIERDQLNDTLSSEAFQQATLRAAEALEMIEPKKLPEGHNKLVVTHGGVRQTPRLRVEEALDPFMNEDGSTEGRSVDIVAALGGNRPVEDIERENTRNYTENYAGEINNEADLMNAAVQHWLREHDLEDVIEQSELIEGTAHDETVSGVPYGIWLYDLRAAKADGRLPATMPNTIVALNAPMDATRQMRRGIKSAYKDRPDTEDPLDMIRQIVDLEPGDRVGSISHHPVSKGQLLITKEVLLEDGVIVEEGAYKSDALINNPGVRFSEICKVVAGAKRLREHAQKLTEFQNLTRLL
jgi:hypothetical protein